MASKRRVTNNRFGSVSSDHVKRCPKSSEGEMEPCDVMRDRMMASEAAVS
jgi:hypothetical protein